MAELNLCVGDVCVLRTKRFRQDGNFVVARVKQIFLTETRLVFAPTSGDLLNFTWDVPRVTDSSEDVDPVVICRVPSAAAGWRLIDEADASLDVETRAVAEAKRVLSEKEAELSAATVERIVALAPTVGGDAS